MPSSLYIHIPFCKRICTYCDFPKVIYAQNWAFSYVKEMLEDLKGLKGPYKTIYVGGGTPTSLSLDLLDELLSALKEKLLEDGEFSIEANPETINEEVLNCLKKNGINRLSIGAQTSSPKWLSYLGRTHSFEDVRKAVSLAKEKGFENINVDMMYGFQGQSKEELLDDIDNFLSLDVPHISAYSLIVEEGTILKNNKAKEDEDLQGDFYEIIVSKLKEAGYIHYEVSNYCKKGYECRHNLTYWKDEEYDALGLGASGYAKGVRYTYTKNFTAYLTNKHKDSEETISPEDDVKFYLTTNLRLLNGFDLDDFEKRFSYRFEERFDKEIDKLINGGLLTISDNKCHATETGILLLDRILIEFY